MQFHRTPSTTSPRPRVRWARRLLAATAAFAKPAHAAEGDGRPAGEGAAVSKRAHEVADWASRSR